MSDVIVSYKGFDKDLKCHGGFQYEIGKEYEQDSATVCDHGFHACEMPLHVFNHFAPGDGSRYCIVEQSGEISRRHESDDSKLASSKIKIGAEIGIPGLVKAQIEYVKSRCTNERNAEPGTPATAGYRGAATAGACGAATAGNRGAATAGAFGAATAGDRGAATAGGWGAATAGAWGAATAGDSGAATAGYSGAATAGYSGAATAGDRGAATAGYRGAATAGYRGAATAGDRGAATAGDRGAATAGYRGAATSRGSVTVGKNGVGTVRGNGVKIRGGVGAFLSIAIENDDNHDISECKSFVIDGENYKPDTWYTLRDGKIVEVNE